MWDSWHSSNGKVMCLSPKWDPMRQTGRGVTTAPYEEIGKTIFQMLRALQDTHLRLCCLQYMEM